MKYDTLADFVHWCNVYLVDEFLQIEPHGLRFGDYRLVFKSLEPEYTNLNKDFLTWRLSRTPKPAKIEWVDFFEDVNHLSFTFYTHRREHPDFMDSTKFEFVFPKSTEVKLMKGVEVLAAHKFCDWTLKYKLVWDTGIAEEDCLTRQQAKRKLRKHFKQEFEFEAFGV